LTFFDSQSQSAVVTLAMVTSPHHSALAEKDVLVDPGLVLKEILNNAQLLNSHFNSQSRLNIG
jgi:hypothetical protein